MNSLAWISAIVASSWLSYFAFEVIDIDELGVAILGIAALSIVMAIRGGLDDWTIAQGGKDEE